MSSITTTTKQKKRFATMDDIKSPDETDNEPQNVAVILSKEIQRLSKDLEETCCKLKQSVAQNIKDDHIKKALVLKYKETTHTIEEYKKLLEELGAKNQIIDNIQEQNKMAYESAMKKIKRSEKIDVNSFTTEELEEINKSAVKELEDLLNGL